MKGFVHVSKRLRIASLLLAFALLVPLSYSSGSGPEITDACADGACCMEINSLCYTDDMFDEALSHYYYRSYGSCAKPYSVTQPAS